MASLILTAAVRYTNSSMTVERSENAFATVNRLRGDLDGLVDVATNCGAMDADTSALFTEYDRKLRELEKLLQVVEKSARKVSVECRGILGAQ